MNSRRQFLTGVAAIGVATPLGEFVAYDDEPQRLDLDMVGKFVAKSHGDIDTVRDLLSREPALVNAAWDWGNGDWETGLGASSHMGRQEIARLLLDKGARLDVFAATMLGMDSVMAEMIKVMPEIHAVRGPHGIPMLSHAIFGQEDADGVFELLLAAGANVNAASNMKMTPLMAAVSLGREEIVEELIKRGADASAADVKGISILDLANRRKNENVIKMIEQALSQQ
jgi:ankyrin repeat protein